MTDTEAKAADIEGALPQDKLDSDVQAEADRVK